MIFTPSKSNPIIKPNPKIPWASLATYNPTVLYENKTYHLFYRAVGKTFISQIGHAISKDGVNFKTKNIPTLSPKLDIEKNGVEDPRITRINTTYFLTHTAYDKKSARLCLATSRDLLNWSHHGLMLPDWNFKKAKGFIVKWDIAQNTTEAKTDWSKAGGIIPAKIKNRYWMLFGDRNIWLATSKNGIKWQAILKPFLKPRPNNFDNIHIEMGPPPIKTKSGWLVLYHGINKNKTYQLGYILLDLKNPTKIIHRSNQPIFSPIEAIKLPGFVDIITGGKAIINTMNKKKIKNFLLKNKMPEVVFCNGAVLVKDTLRIYYGINDTYIGTATAKLKDILNSK
ncbi:MAG: hypothetical protein NTW06_00655 [Candidatus Falkowbacteria bacterium]|nr:hypothetical protein [Candidatus Falkowbacteria bacterium]